MKVLVIVDMQNDFITGPLGSPEAVKAKDNLTKYLKDFDMENNYIIFTKDTHYENYFETLEGERLPIPHCQAYTNGYYISQDIWDYVKDNMEQHRWASVNKMTFGSINDLNEMILNFIMDEPNHDLDEIIICGLDTDICVVSNALILRATYPDLPITCLANCCAGSTPEKHEAALKVMESCMIDIVKE